MRSERNSDNYSWPTFGLPKTLYVTVWISLTISLIAILFDFFRRPGKDGVIPGTFEPMKMITAICFILIITIVFLQRSKHRFAKLISFLLAILVLVISSLTLFEHYVHFKTDMLSILSRIGIVKNILIYEARMTVSASVSFFLLSLIFVLLHFRKTAIAHIICIAVSLISYFFLLTYILEVNTPVSGIVPMSLNTSIALAGICISLFMLYPETWLMKVFASGTISSILARQLVIPLIIIPVIVGWFRITGEREGIFSSEVGVVLVAIVYTFCFTGLVWLSARSVNKIDQKRIESENITAKSYARTDLLSHIANKLLITENLQQIINDLCNEVKDYLNCELFFNFLVDDFNSNLQLNAYSGITVEEARKIKQTEFGRSGCGCVAGGGVPIISEYVQETHGSCTDIIKGFDVRAYACHPLLSHNKVLGTLSFGTKNRDKFSSEDISLMKIVADQVAIAIGRLRNEKALRESEDRFRTIAESLPVQIAVTRISDATVIFTNDSYDLSFGYAKHDAVGKKAQDFYRNKEDRLRIMTELSEKGYINNFETQVLRSDGKPFWIIASIRKILYEGEPAYISALVDIDQVKTAQKELLQLNHTLNAMGKSSNAMMHMTDELKYLSDVCRIIIEDCGYLMVWIGYARDDENKTVEPMAYHGFDRGYIEKMNISWADTIKGKGPTGTAIRTGQPAICRDMQNDPDFAPWREEAIKRGYASSIVLPLVSDQRVFGAISIYSKEPDAFTMEDIKLLSNLADDLAYGITYIRLTVSEKNAAKAIKESEEKYRLLFDEMTEGFSLHEIILDSHGHPYDYKFISVNPSFERQTGLKAVNVIGKTAKEILPGLEDYWIENYGRVAMTGKSIEFENYAGTLNSYFRVSAFSPKKRFFAVIFENITERVIAEKELRNTKNYLENLINYANAPIIVWNTAAEIQLFNHAFEHLTGYTAQDVLGKKLDMLFPESTLAASNEKIKLALTKNWETSEIPILTKDNLIRTILWNSANIYDTDNSVLSTIAQGNDITDRILAENEVRSAKEKLDLALENANIGIWTWHIKNDLFEWDERISRMLAMDPANETNSYNFLEKYIYEEDLPHFKRAIAKTLQDDIMLDTIFRSRTPSGEFKYIDAKAKVERNSSGDAVKMTGVCFDITSMQKATEHTLFTLNEDLLRSNKELEQFAYVASHDLQEPLRMISSFTQLLAARYHDKLDKQAQEFIDFAVDGAQRMQRLINDLLQYSRINTRGKPLSVVNMNEIIKQTINNLSLKIEEKKAVITIDTLPAVFADESQMVQLFQNLIENGIKFCDNIPDILITSTEETDFFRFSVKDNGIGIESQYFDRIFHIFQRLHLKEEYSGTGIGLAICKRIVERHGGRIWAVSNGHGTEFQFTIKKTQNILYESPQC